MRLCLGTVQFGMKYGIQGNNRPSVSSINNMLCMAIDCGVNCFDTASAYGDAEAVLGQFMIAYPEYAKKMKIISKLKPQAFENESKIDWIKIAIENAEESLHRIGINKFSDYLFHNAQYIFDQEALNALKMVKEEGLTERIGVSIYTPQEAMKALEHTEIEAIQIPYNVFDQRLDKCGFFDKALEKKVYVYARSSLLQGVVMMKPDCLPKTMNFARSYLRTFLSICSKYSIDPLNAAVGYVAAHQGIDCVVFGVDNEIQLIEYVSMQEHTIPEAAVKEFIVEFENVEEKLVNPVLWDK